MEKPLLAGALLVAGAMASIGAVAGFVAASRPLYAEVVDVKPITRPEAVKEQECRDTRMSRGKSAKSSQRMAGTAIGGMVGGVIGHQFGEGGGRTLANAAGAADNGTQKAVQENNAHVRCRVVDRTEQRVYAYDVRYRLDGRLGKVRMDQAPGKRIPVKDGRLLLAAPDAGPEEQKI